MKIDYENVWLGLSKSTSEQLIRDISRILRSVFEDSFIVDPSGASRFIFANKPVVAAHGQLDLQVMFTKALTLFGNSLELTGIQKEALIHRLHKAMYHHFKMLYIHIEKSPSTISYEGESFVPSSGHAFNFNDFANRALNMFTGLLDINKSVSQ